MLSPYICVYALVFVFVLFCSFELFVGFVPLDGLSYCVLCRCVFVWLFECSLASFIVRCCVFFVRVRVLFVCSLGRLFVSGFVGRLSEICVCSFVGWLLCLFV